MLKILGIIVGALVLAAVGVVAYASTRPDTFRVSRSATIKAPPDRVYAIITDFKRWPEWSPWQHLDPAMKTTVSGAATGKGAISTWDGNSQVGAGRSEIVDAVAPSRVTMKLDMVRPMEAHNVVDYTLVPKGDATEVTWAMHGGQPLMAKVFGVFVDCEKMVGKDFETGLANLRKLAEK